MAITYVPWFLKSSLIAIAPSNDPAAFKEIFALKEQYPRLSQAILKILEGHPWYLTQELALLSLGDGDLEDEAQIKLLKKLLEFEEIEPKIGKPNC